MALLIKKPKGVIFTGIARLSIIGFIVAVASAFVSTIWAIYMDSFFNNIVEVGFFSAFLTLVSFVSLFLFIPLIERLDKGKIFSFSILIYALTYLLFAINTNFYFFIVLSFLATLLLTLRIESFGIIIRDKSTERRLSRNEGVVYTFFNLAFVLGPLIAGYIADKYNLSIVFVLAAVFSFIAFLVFKTSKIKDRNIKKRIDKSMWRNFHDFFKDKKRKLSYVLGGGVNLWWSLIYLFMPLFIMRQGLGTLWVGYFLFAIPIPLICLEYAFAKLAGKIGFKKIFKIGFFIPCVLAFLCFFVSNIYIILLLLILASVGLAMVEPTTEAYFFDILKGKQRLRFYGPYSTTIPLNQFIGRILSSFILIFLPFKFIFLLFSLFMFIMFLSSFKVRNIIEKKRGKKRNNLKIQSR